MGKVTPEQDPHYEPNADRVLFVFPRGDAELRIADSTFRGKRFLSVRKFFKHDRGDWVATKQGASVYLDELPKLREAIDEILEATGK